MEIKLTGHSGCSVSVIENNNRYFVRKKSKNHEYNNRLKQQYEKQKNLELGKIKSTPTFGEGYDDNGLYYFDMEYLNGMTLAKAISIISLEHIYNLSVRLLGNPITNIYDKHACDYFYKKTESVIDNILKMNYFNDKNNYKELLLINNSKKKLLQYDWRYIVRSPCHGDFTLENIILTNGNQLYAIDFLDSFYDSWEIDVAKILQDVELGWSYRNITMDENLSIRLLILKNNILEIINKMENGKEITDTIYHILLLNVIRIIPYTEDEKTMKFLTSKIDYLLKYKVKG